MDASVPPYIPVPSAAVLIAVPADLPTEGEGATSSSSPNTLSGAGAGSSGIAAAVARTRAPAFPPAVAAANAASASAASRKFTVPGAAALSSNVSDMVLSSLLPPNLPRLAQTHHAPGRARDLTSQKEGLGLNVMSNNFRRFLTKVSGLARRNARLKPRTRRLKTLTW